MSHQISKSSFLKGIQCEKQIYLYKHHYDWRDPISENQQYVFDRGHSVGGLAQELFPGGKNLALESPLKYMEAVRSTEAELRKDSTIYEAAFLHDDVLVISDIFIKNKKSCHIYEVKSTTSVKDVIIWDAAVQYYVVSKLGYKVDDVSIVFLNNQYVRRGDLELNKLFTIVSVLDEVVERLPQVEAYIKKFKKVLAQKKIPDIGIGPHCSDPYDCSFLGHCWKDIPEYSIFNIANLKAQKKFDLYNKGVIKFKDIPADYDLNEKQWQQVNAHLKNTNVIDKKEIKNYLKQIIEPVMFLDFETFAPAVPMFDDSRPYQQIPFQYSLHILEGGKLSHFEFLADAGKDPRIDFIKSLLSHLRKSGTILTYNQSFEITRLKEIAADFPVFEKEINRILSRVVDLITPFRERYYYTPEMRGSYSIKQVLPALIPDLTYNSLNIQEGSLASIAYESLIYETDIIKVQQARKDLLEYCKMDTLAMVELLNKLRKIL